LYTRYDKVRLLYIPKKYPTITGPKVSLDVYTAACHWTSFGTRKIQPNSQTFLTQLDATMIY